MKTAKAIQTVEAFKALTAPKKATKAVAPKKATKAVAPKKAVAKANAPRRLAAAAKKQMNKGAGFARPYLSDSTLSGVNFELVNKGIALLTKTTDDGITPLGRKGNKAFDQYQPLSGIVDNWLVKCARAGAVNWGDIVTLIETAGKAENFTSKLPPLGQQTKKVAALTAALHTYNQVIASLQAIRLQSVSNTVKKLNKVGYSPTETTAIIIGLNQIAGTVRPGLMQARSNIKAAIKAATSK